MSKLGGSGGYLFGKTAAERIKAAVLKSEAPPGGGSPRPNWPVISSLRIMDAIVTTAITPATVSGGVTTYGTGNATIMIDTKSGSTYTDSPNVAFPAGSLVLNYLENTGT